MVEDKRDQFNRTHAENYGWYINGDISNKTLAVIYNNKELDDEILGFFVYESNKVLILSKLYVKVLDRGFFRSSYNFNTVKYDGFTEIQRQSNCIFFVRNNNLRSKFCLQSKEACDKAIEIILQMSNLENVTILPDLELIRQKEKEEKQQRRIEKRRQQWKERQRQKRYARSIEKGLTKKQQSPSPNACLGCGSNNPEDSNFCLTCGVSL